MLTTSVTVMDHILREQSKGVQSDVAVIEEEIGTNVVVADEKMG